jgi:hypothetical protein
LLVQNFGLWLSDDLKQIADLPVQLSPLQHRRRRGQSLTQQIQCARHFLRVTEGLKKNLLSARLLEQALQRDDKDDI